MNRHNELAREGNPFASRYVRPGSIPFLFLADDSAADLVARLAGHGWWGEIVGPHGSGKSTLLAALRPDLAAAGRRPVDMALHDGRRQLPIRLEQLPAFDAETLVIVDGYEQLGWLARRRLTRACRRASCGLVATAHASVGLPLLARTGATVEIAQQVVARLLDGWPPLVTPDDVARAFQAHCADLREALFALYDLYEVRRRTSIAWVSQ
jgi:hypothetical protein